MARGLETNWRVNDRFLELHSRWLTLIGEHLQDDRGRTLEYWRIEKADSAIVLPLHGRKILLPPPSYRPGVERVTLDFPGGRVPEGSDPREVAPTILERELGVEPTAIAELTPLNSEGWAVNSSFSNQRLHAFAARLQDVDFTGNPGVSMYPADPEGVRDLLRHLTCLQCRAVLLEWWLGQG